MSPQSPHPQPFNNISVPPGLYGTGNNPSPTAPPQNGLSGITVAAQASPQVASSQPGAQAGPGAMGPPLKPPEKEKTADANQLADVLQSTGVDLQEEESGLLNSFFDRRAQPNNFFSTSFSTPPNSQSSIASHPGSVPAGFASQLPPGGESSFYGAGLANQPPEPSNGKTKEQLEKEAADEAWHAAARNLAISQQAHSPTAFLQMQRVHDRIKACCSRSSLNGPEMRKLYEPPKVRPPIPTHTGIAGDGTMMMTTNLTFIEASPAAADIFALLTLATQERLRSLIEDAATLASGRRIGSHGLVPGEWADLALTTGAEAFSATSQGGLANAESSNPDSLKRT
jgi:hypothetical protein